MFLAKERLAHRDTASLLSCNDLVEIMCDKLPTRSKPMPTSSHPLRIAIDDYSSPRFSPAGIKPLSFRHQHAMESDN